VGEWPNHTQRGKEEEERENYIHPVYLMKSGFFKIIFKIFLYLFVSRKVGQQKTLSDQRKI
jgi:hypothetical protein